MKKTILLALLTLALCVEAQTNQPPVTNPPPATITGALQELQQAIVSGQSNWIIAPYGLYAPGLKHRYGGGIGAFYPFSQYILAGTRLDYVNSGFWMPSGNVTLQMPVKLFGAVTVTPLGYAGLGLPLSGAQVGSVTLPGSPPADNNGQPTAILGYGGAIQLYKSSTWTVDLVGDVETWSGFPKQQYRAGFAIKHVF